MLEIGYLNSPIGILKIKIEDGAVTEITNHVTPKETAAVTGRTRAAAAADEVGEADVAAAVTVDEVGADAVGEAAPASPRSDAMEVVMAEMVEYFEGRRQKFDFAMAPAGTEFQQQVWKALLEIPFGQTLSYSQVAEQIGRPKASRAVGSAVGANPILIAVPCHRVIRGDGGLGGFSAGLPNKIILHELEGISCQKR